MELSRLMFKRMGEDNVKIVVRLPEPRKVYTEDNQRQINRSIASVIEQLNSTYQQPEKDDQERYNFFLS